MGVGACRGGRGRCAAPPSTSWSDRALGNQVAANPLRHRLLRSEHPILGESAAVPPALHGADPACGCSHRDGRIQRQLDGLREDLAQYRICLRRRCIAPLGQKHIQGSECFHADAGVEDLGQGEDELTATVIAEITGPGQRADDNLGRFGCVDVREKIGQESSKGVRLGQFPFTPVSARQLQVGCSSAVQNHPSVAVRSAGHLGRSANQVRKGELARRHDSHSSRTVELLQRSPTSAPPACFQLCRAGEQPFSAARQ